MHVYHGKARAETAADLARYGVVLTTYTTMALEAPSSPDAKSGTSAATPIDLCDSSSDSDADGALRAFVWLEGFKLAGIVCHNQVVPSSTGIAESFLSEVESATGHFRRHAHTPL